MDVYLAPLPSTSRSSTAHSKNTILYYSDNCHISPFLPSYPTTKPPIMSFEKAIADSKKLTSKPSNEELLDLYGATMKSGTVFL